jgi:hypothetical protein
MQYNPQQHGNQQQQQQQQQQQHAAAQQQQAQMAAQVNAAGAAANLANIDKNLIFQNDRLAQQYALQSAGPGQATFSTLHDDPNNQVADPTMTQSPDDTQNDGDDKDSKQTSASGRVLASSKRAAQNRAAQRAFRQRKDRYIKSLEQRATDYDLSHNIIADLRKENIYLRDYVVRLQNEVDSLNTELGRAPMFASPPTQRPTSSQTQQQSAMALTQNYPLQLDPATAAGNQDNQSGLARLAPAETTHHAISMPAGNETMGETKIEDTGKKTNRGRKRKNEAQAEGQ